jgi:queuine tRNA-ribosyltransferase
LQKANEILAVMLLTWHNIRYYQRLMSGLRNAIETDTLNTFVEQFYSDQKQGDIKEL